MLSVLMVPEEPFFLSLVLANDLKDQVILVRNAYFFVKFGFTALSNQYLKNRKLSIHLKLE